MCPVRTTSTRPPTHRNNDVTREEIVAEARRYAALKTPWRHRGRSETGLDCIGLAVMIFDKFGLEYMDQSGYSRTPDGDKFVDLMKAHFTVASPVKLKPGMLIVFQDSSRPCHVGIYAERDGQPRIIHATADRRVTIEEPYDRHLSSRFRMALDFPGVED